MRLVAGPRFTPKARQDLDDIWNFTVEHWGTAQADRYVVTIVGVCQDLATGLRSIGKQAHPEDHRGFPVMDPKKIVAHGYDQIAERYADWTAASRHDPRGRYMEIFLTALPEGAKVLELVCGSGNLTTKHLAERFIVTRVDISAR